MSNLIRINRDTKYYGILGYPLSHTLSPLIHNTLFSLNGLNSVYIVLEKEHPDKYSLFKERGLIKIHGVSVTIPHKEWAYDISDECDEAGKIMEASNTLVLSEEGHIQSFNTDGMGALRAILENKKSFLNSDEHVLILGSGGSARGISFEILRQGFKGQITISSRNEDTGRSLTKALNSYKSSKADYVSLSNLGNDGKKFSYVINTTPVGMKGNTSKAILKDGFINKNHVVFDIVYNPLHTPLVLQAKKAGAKIIPGYEMLLFQALEQFKIFTGKEVPVKNIPVVKKLLESELKKKK